MSSDYRKAYKKQWYEANKDRLIARRKSWYEKKIKINT